MDPERAPRYRVGGADLQIVSDGTFYQDAGVLMGVVPRSVWEPVTGAPDERNMLPLALNTLLVRSMGKIILVDTGIGVKLNETQRTRFWPGDYGHLLRRLRALGVQPEDVDAVINTHLHFDHCGWNTVNVHGVPLPAFPRATYYMQQGEYEAATHPNERTRGAYLPENFESLVESGNVELVTGEVAVTPDVRMVPLAGHTADHAGVFITSGGQTAIFSGDMSQHGTQLARLAWISAFDTLPLVNLETKRALLERAVREQALLISPHAEFPGVGRIRDVNGRPAFVAEPPEEPA